MSFSLQKVIKGFPICNIQTNCIFLNHTLNLAISAKSNIFYNHSYIVSIVGHFCVYNILAAIIYRNKIPWLPSNFLLINPNRKEFSFNCILAFNIFYINTCICIQFFWLSYKSTTEAHQKLKLCFSGQKKKKKANRDNEKIYFI